MIYRIKLQAEEILKKRGNHTPLGCHWVEKFLNRHHSLKSCFCTLLDKERINAVNYETINHWFKLFSDTMKQYNIEKRDVYNMDEKGFAVGQAGKQKVVVSKANLNAYMCQNGSREWVSLLECISADGALLPAFVIFKAKTQRKAWMNELERGNNIAISDKGWTNNTLAFEWFKRVFDPYSKKRQQGEYRLLILDRHASHITSEVIQFCINEKIILACLPAHTTHVLQPLDVGFFQPFGSLYRTKLLRLIKWDSSANVDRVDFIDLYQRARSKTAKLTTIFSAWQKALLFPLDPESLLKTLPQPKDVINTVTLRPYTPPEVFFRSSDGVTISAPIKTPRNAAEFDEIVHKAIDGKATQQEIMKLGKAGSKTYVEKVLLETTNTELLENQQCKKEKAKRSNQQLGKGRIMNHDVLEEREMKKHTEEQKKRADKQEKEF